MQLSHKFIRTIPNYTIDIDKIRINIIDNNSRYIGIRLQDPEKNSSSAHEGFYICNIFNGCEIPGQTSFNLAQQLCLSPRPFYKWLCIYLTVSYHNLYFKTKIPFDFMKTKEERNFTFSKVKYYFYLGKNLNTMACNKDHSKIQHIMESLPVDQGGIGRHKCAACAYEQGYEDGLNRKEKIDLETLLNSLEESQAQGQRHKSPHAGYAKGYYDGIVDSYKR